jgi:hypothetical protein
MSPLEDTVRCISREVSILESLILHKWLEIGLIK